MKRCLFGIAIALCLSQPVQAAGCYTPEEYRAEQAVRFHTNLMVVGLYCKAVLQQNTYATYQDFTRRNQNVIQKQENLLIAYFRQNRMPSPEKALHSMRTDLANKTSLQAGQSIVSFCKAFAPAYARSKGMIPADFQRWIEQVAVNGTQPSLRPACAAAQRR